MPATMAAYEIFVAGLVMFRTCLYITSQCSGMGNQSASIQLPEKPQTHDEKYQKNTISPMVRIEKMTVTIADGQATNVVYIPINQTTNEYVNP